MALQETGSIESMGPGEYWIGTIHKHPFGIIVIYLQFIIALFAALGLILFIGPQFIPEETRVRYGVVFSLLLTAVLGIVGLLLLLATYVYRQNKLIISDQNVTQVSQRGIFSRQVSELSLLNVEDVTSDQNGFLPTIFNYGVLRIETAGEQNNFHFTYCPRPNYYGKMILEARQGCLLKTPRPDRP